MNPFNTFKNNLDEVVFDHRNKAYGAYAIRKAYPDHMNRGMLFTLTPMVFFVAWGIVWSLLHPLPANMLQLLANKKPAMPPDNRVIEISNFHFALPALATTTPNFKIVKDKLVKNVKENPTPITPVDEGIIGTTTGTIASTLPDVGTGTLPSISIDKPNVSGTLPVIDFVDNMPEFPGGPKAMYDFIRQNIQYPKFALDNGVNGKVVLSFVVMPDGTINEPKLIKGIGFGCDDEALRVVNEMPLWTPGSQNGNKVAVRFILPINFQTTQ